MKHLLELFSGVPQNSSNESGQAVFCRAWRAFYTWRVSVHLPSQEDSSEESDIVEILEPDSESGEDTVQTKPAGAPPSPPPPSQSHPGARAAAAASQQCACGA